MILVNINNHITGCSMNSSQQSLYITDENLEMEHSISEQLLKIHGIIISNQGFPKSLVEYVTQFMNQIELLNNAAIKEGASTETLLKDLACVINILSEPTHQNIAALHARIVVNNEASSNRVNAGIGVTSVGVGLLTTAAYGTVSVLFGLALFGSTILTGPVCIGLATLGATLSSTGPVLAVDASNKRGNLADYETLILNAVIDNLIEQNNYAAYALANLTIILSDAKQRDKANLLIKSNEIRNSILTRCMENITTKSNIFEITDCLRKALINIIGNSYNSKTALPLSILKDVITVKYCQELIKNNEYLQCIKFVLDMMIQDELLIKYNQTSVNEINLLTKEINDFIELIKYTDFPVSEIIEIIQRTINKSDQNDKIIKTLENLIKIVSRDELVNTAEQQFTMKKF